MADTTVAVVVSVPEEHFDDEGGLCLRACSFVCQKLESHLKNSGHSIPDWLRGGCEEDWGVYLRTMHFGSGFEFHISFFPIPAAKLQDSIVVQYRRRLPFIQRLWRKDAELPPGHPLHETMRQFARQFDDARVLTRSELASSI